MARHDEAAGDRAWRFREIALPYLDDAYTLACFLMQDRKDAGHAVQKCYEGALRDFDRWPASAIKPRLLAILRKVCYRELDRRGRQKSQPNVAYRELLRRQPQTSSAWEMLKGGKDAAIPRLINSLPVEFREFIVLRELNDMSYREIAEVVGVSLGTVAPRLAQARAMLAAAKCPLLSAHGPTADTLRQFMALGRYGKADDIANAVAFLASAKAQYITGSTLTVDGGANA